MPTRQRPALFQARHETADSHEEEHGRDRKIGNERSQQESGEKTRGELKKHGPDGGRLDSAETGTNDPDQIIRY